MNDDQLAQQMLQISATVAGLQETVKGALKRIDEQKQLSESVHSLALSVRDLTNAQNNMSIAVTTLQKDVDELRAKPAKRWESAVGTVITVMLTSVVTYFYTIKK